MSWIVNNKEAAEAAGADQEGDMVMFAITPNSVAEVYNRHRNAVSEDHEDYRDLWGELSPEIRRHHIRAVELYINKHMTNIDEDIEDCINWVTKHPEEAAQNA